MKKNLFFLLGLCFFLSCRKGTPSEAAPEAAPPPPGNTSTNYSSLQQFYDENGVKLQTYTLISVSGGSMVSPRGTTISVPPNAFAGNFVEPVTIEFKDIYKKSDMLLSNAQTELKTGGPLQSAGEFFIKASDASGSPLQIDQGKNIAIKQPTSNIQGGGIPGFALSPFIAIPDSLADDTASFNSFMWISSPNASLVTAASSYVFSLYSFGQPLTSGTWCNSDNSSYFTGFQQTTLTIHPTFNIPNYHPDVFIVFKTVNSMIHVYRSGADFPYRYAPAGLQCTIVVLGAKDGKFYAGFTPTTIMLNQTVNVSLSEMTVQDFTTALNALN